MKNQYQPCDYEVVLEAPFGAIAIIVQGLLITIELMTSTHAKKTTKNPLAQVLTLQIEAYIKDAQGTFNAPILLKGTPFQRRVWQEICTIPSGQVQTYSDIAGRLKSSPRAVANACGANRLPLFIPCHRVVAKNGIGGFMQGAQEGLYIKKWLLKHEGAMDGNGHLV
jgi:methylated-DNA-[protein]-cysteine S-methyltransferase